MVSLCRRRSLSLNPVFIPTASRFPFSFLLPASLSQHAADRKAWYTAALLSFFQVELVSALLNNEWASLQVINASLPSCYVYSVAPLRSEPPDGKQGKCFDSPSCFRTLQQEMCYCDMDLNSDSSMNGVYFSLLHLLLFYSKWKMPIHSQRLPLEQRCNGPFSPQAALKFHLIRSNGVKQTLLEDSVPHIKPYLSAAVADIKSRYFITSFFTSANNTSPPPKHL